jgi:hypothetical protein
MIRKLFNGVWLKSGGQYLKYSMLVGDENCIQNWSENILKERYCLGHRGIDGSNIKLGIEELWSDGVN